MTDIMTKFEKSQFYDILMLLFYLTSNNKNKAKNAISISDFLQAYNGSKGERWMKERWGRRRMRGREMR